jgi:predicted nucleotide-binding protein
VDAVNTEHTTVAGVQLTSAACDEVAAVMRDVLTEFLQVMVKRKNERSAEEIRSGIFGHYPDSFEEYTGDLDDHFYAYVSSMKRGGRERRNDATFGAYSPSAFAEIDGGYDSCTVVIATSYADLTSITLAAVGTTVEVTLTFNGNHYLERVSVERIEDVLNRYPAPGLDVSNPTSPFRVFVGHGNDTQWRVLRDELRDDHGYEIEFFEGQPRAGWTISDVLADMAQNSTVAVLVLAGSDAMSDGGLRGRQNVVHEIGYFQAMLGWSNTIVVVEEGVEMFSNLDGTQQVRYPKGNISAATGGVVAALRSRRLAHDDTLLPMANP